MHQLSRLAGIAILVAACGGTPATPTSPAASQPASPSSPASTAPQPTVSETPAVASATASPVPTASAPVAWIIYQGGDGLTLMHPDGTGSRPALLTGPAQARHADWSPDGMRFTFVVDEADGTRDIWTADWNGLNARRLVDCSSPCISADDPAWSPDGTRIAFDRLDSVNGVSSGSKIQAVDVKTGTVAALFATQGAEYVSSGRWSPDGHSLVVVLDRFRDDLTDTTGDSKGLLGETVAVLSLATVSPTLHLLRPSTSFSNFPDWQPSGDLIVFAAGNKDPLDSQAPPENLFTIRPDGTGLRQLTHQGATDDGIWMPAYRPDGSAIIATLVMRPPAANYSLLLGAVSLDGAEVSILGGGTGMPGAHARQRPIPAP